MWRLQDRPFLAVAATLVVVTLTFLIMRPKPRRPVASRPSDKNLVSHVVVRCVDLEKSLRFYQAIGFLEASRTEASILLSLPQGSTYKPFLLFQQVDAKIPLPSSNWHAAMAGYGRVAFVVPSVQTYVERMKEEFGLAPIADPITDTPKDKEGKPLHRITLAAWRDPDGVIVEVIENNDFKMRALLATFHAFGAFQYPIWLHCNINATNYDRTWAAFQDLGFEMENDYGRVVNKLYQSLAIPDPGIAKKVALIKAKHDAFHVDLIEWDLIEWENSKTDLPREGLPQRGLCSMAVVLRGEGGVPKSWKENGAEFEMDYPSPLGSASVQEVLDPDGISVQLVRYK
uniref:VOC domain-containing protein n=1 Tax=Grammatophora oceanica TaxID=210454 RepID=A0A7S1UWK2_9STRA|mmetsp:Transcript_27199/g.39838  ORF Transcript_27199/g.39838 Transcript_27199/m.39838 type:complete len:343 (+) Transcript_27199:44-1072(+)